MGPQPQRNNNIQGEPLSLEEMLELAEIDLEDIESAAQWWDDNASPEWRGALDSEPVDDDNATP